MSVEARDRCNGHDLKKSFVELVKRDIQAKEATSTPNLREEICCPLAKNINGI